MNQQKRGIFQAGDQSGPNKSSKDSDDCTFALHSAWACMSSLTPYSPILQLRKLRFTEMKLLVQGHPALVGSQTPGPSYLLLPCAVFLKPAFH